MKIRNAICNGGLSCFPQTVTQGVNTLQGRRRAFPAILFSLMLYGQIFAQNLQQNLWVTAGGPNNGEVNAIAYSESTNTIYIGGSFTYVGPHTDRGAALSVSSGGADSGFPKVNGTIRAVVPDGSGGWFIGGDFDRVGGQTRNRLAHINSDKTLDLNWNPRTTNGVVYALALSGSKLYVGGTFSMIGDSSRSRLAALNVQTGSMTNWNRSGAENIVYSLAISGARLYVGGTFDEIGTPREPRVCVAALDTLGGAVISGWNPIISSTGYVYAIAALGQRIFIGGRFTSVNGSPRGYLAAIDANGALMDWTPNANWYVRSLAASGSTVYAGGEFTSVSGITSLKYVAAIDTAGQGTPKNWSSQNNNNDVYALALSGSRLYVGGTFTNMGNQVRNRIAVLDTANGTAIGTWNPNANNSVHALAISDSTVYVGGEFTTIGGITRNGIAAIDGATGLPTSWNPNAGFSNPSLMQINALALSGTTLYVGGRFTTIGDSNRSRIAALNTTTGKATGWNPNITTSNGNAAVYSLAVSGSIVYVGGDFAGSATIGGRQRTAIAAIHVSTGNATAWNPSPNVSTVYAIAVSGSTVYVGGNFTSIGGASRSRLAALDATQDTLMASPWNPGPNGTVNAILSSGSLVYVGGSFDRIGTGTPQPERGRIAALDATGQAVATWQANISQYSVQSLAQAGSSLYAGGNFTNIGGQPRNRVAALGITDGAPSQWDPNAPGSNLTYVNAIAISYRNSRIYVGGNFEAIKSESRTGFAGMDNPSDPPTSVREVGGDPVPSNFVLSQNYPNPFNPSTKIRFQLPNTHHVTLKVYDILGKEVATLVNESLTPGSYETTFDGSSLSSGVYFYRLQSGSFVETRKLILQK